MHAAEAPAGTERQQWQPPELQAATSPAGNCTWSPAACKSLASWIRAWRGVGSLPTCMAARAACLSRAASTALGGLPGRPVGHDRMLFEVVMYHVACRGSLHAEGRHLGVCQAIIALYT